MKIILIGYMGSGKSSVGKQLATRLNYEFVDLDHHIELEEHTTIQNIFSEKGELYFRKAEMKYLQSFLFSDKNIVLATGGGTPCYGDSIQQMLSAENTITIYLNENMEVLTERLFLERESRPLIAHFSDSLLLKDFIRKHLFERSHYYNQANVVINTQNASVDTIVEKIVAILF